MRKSPSCVLSVVLPGVLSLTVAGCVSHAGAFPVVSAVGNPPFVGAIATGTDVQAVFVESLDQAGLVVNDKIKSNNELAKEWVSSSSRPATTFRPR